MTVEEKDCILNSYKWIKVKRFVDDESLSWQKRFEKLSKHHVEETTFLIDEIRRIIKTECNG